MAGVKKSLIEKHLKELNKLYNDSTSNIHSIFYSKLALIEYCGWLEDSIDIIVMRTLKNVIDQNLNKIGQESIKRNYGFTYQGHFRDLLIKTLGLCKTQELLASLRQSGNLAILESKLNTFKNLRNDAAHQYFTGTQSYHSPSFYLNELSLIYPIFNEIYSYLVKHIK